MMTNKETRANQLDQYTGELLEDLFSPADDNVLCPQDLGADIQQLLGQAQNAETTAPIVDLFIKLKYAKFSQGLTPEMFDISMDTLILLSEKHQRIDEHEVTIGGRVNQALPIVQEANQRVKAYLKTKGTEAPSGIELWDTICENTERIKFDLNIGDEEWNTYSGQIKNCIDSVEKLSKVVKLPEPVIKDIGHVIKNYRMRLTPYYASLIQPEKKNDPVLLQSVPTVEMVDNVGIEIPPVAADHSPARLIDQFYPQTVTIKATNMCAMYCTHCLRIAHIGKKDRIYSDKAYEEALDYIRNNPRIRDVLITGGDTFVLPNKIIKNILNALDNIDHVRIKRLGTRIPVTVPWLSPYE